MKQWTKMMAGVGLLLALPWAQGEEAPACIEVTVGGYKTPDYNCLSRQMGNDPQAATAAQRSPGCHECAGQRTRTEQHRPGNPGDHWRAHGQYVWHVGQAPAAAGSDQQFAAAQRK